MVPRQETGSARKSVSSAALSKPSPTNRPVATMETSDDEPAQTNPVGVGFQGDSWYEAGITITSTSAAENCLSGWAINGDPHLGPADSDSDLLLVLDEPATQLGLNWPWGDYADANCDLTLYSDTNHSQSLGSIELDPAIDGETNPGEDGYDLGVLSTEAFQSVRISSSSTYATIDDLVYVPSPEPSLLIAQLGALLTLSLLCWKRG